MKSFWQSGAALASVAVVVLSACSDPAPQSAATEVLAGKPAKEISCAALAASPLERIDGQPGVRSDKILAPLAIEACEAHVKLNPEDATGWRHLQRAYMAGVRYGKMDTDTYLPLLIQAADKAAELGDVASAVDILVSNMHSERDRPALLARITDLRARLEAQNLTEAVDLVAIATLRAEEQTRTMIANPSIDIEDARAADEAGFQKFAAILKAAAAKVGYSSVAVAAREFKLDVTCDQHLTTCRWFDRAIESSADAPAYLTIAADSLAEAYWIIDHSFSKPDSTAKDHDFAAYAADGWAADSQKYATLAINVGNPAQKTAGEELLAGFNPFHAYKNERFKLAEAEAKQAEQRAWMALATLLVSSMAEGERQSSYYRNGKALTPEELRVEQLEYECASLKNYWQQADSGYNNMVEFHKGRYDSCVYQLENARHQLR